MSRVFAQKIAALRTARGLTQKQAADGLHISQPLLSQYENYSREPRIEFILRACDFYGVTADFLIGRTDDPHGNVAFPQAEGYARTLAQSMSELAGQLRVLADTAETLAEENSL